MLETIILIQIQNATEKRLSDPKNQQTQQLYLINYKIFKWRLSHTINQLDLNYPNCTYLQRKKNAFQDKQSTLKSCSSQKLKQKEHLR